MVWTALDSLSDAYRRVLVRWMDGVRRFAWPIVVVAALATAAAGAYFARHLHINTDTTDMISPELPFRKLSGALSEAFPQFSDNILVVIEGDTPDLADDAALALAARLRQKPALFGAVVDQTAEPFFRRHGLLFLDIDDLNDLSDRLAEAQPFIGALWRDPSLRGLFAMLDLAIDETLKKDGAPIELGTTLNAISEVVEAQASGRFRHLSWQELMSGKTAKTKDKRRFLQIQPALDYESLQPAATAIQELRRIVADLKLDATHGVRVRLTGSVALNQEELKTVEDNMGLASVVSMVLVIGLLVVGLRSARLTVATLATLVVGLAWTAYFAIAAFGELNLISIAFAVLFIGLGVDFGIHFTLRYWEETAGGKPHVEALRGAGREVGSALTLAAVTTMIGFYAFAPTDYRGLAQLGWISGTGMFIAWFASLTVLPALLSLMPLGADAARPAKSRILGLGRRVLSFTQRRARPTLWLTAIVTVAAIALAPRAYFDFDPLNLKDPRTESVRTLRDLMDDGEAGRYAIDILARNLDTARALATRLGRVPEVDETRTLASFVPKNQDEKLAVIGNMALFLAPSLAAVGADPPPSDAERQAALVKIEDKLAALARASGNEAARPAARLLAALKESFGAGVADVGKLKDLETRLITGLGGRLEALRQSLDAGPVTLAGLPDDLRRRYIAADGRARLEVLPKEDLRDRAALKRFVEAVRRIAPDATGSPVVQLESGETIVRAFRHASVLALACIVVVLLVVLRSVRDTVLALVPMALAALFTAAFSSVFNYPFNYANVIVLPLLFGMSVVFGIHMVLREREKHATAEVLASSTPRAMLFSALTTIASFGSLALSSHPGTASMGVLLTVAVLMALVCSLVVLPALMAQTTAPRRGVSVAL
jgi:hopanoid biosynthesis associated RND transporter like protein HpnN